MFSIPRWTRLLTVGLLAAQTVQSVNLTANSKQYFDESMTFLDTIFDKSVSYLYYFYYPLAAGPHETRSTVWYAAGLLQRNEGDDLEQAIAILKNVIGDQYKNESQQWFGDYTVYPEQPTVDTEWYPKDVQFPSDPRESSCLTKQ